MVKNRKNNREWLNEYKRNNSCILCGESHVAVLDFHHIDRSTKRATVAELAGTATLEEVRQEVNKCILLCSNCHRKIHWAEEHEDYVVLEEFERRLI